ncbi:MAG TPA: EAL domain-containing protein [Aurantimonas sp.]
MSDAGMHPLCEFLDALPDGKEAERWRFALESAGSGVWDADLVAGTCYYSSSWKRMLGYADDELDDDPDLWLAFVHPADRHTAIASGDRHVAGETARIETEFRLRHKNGGWIWVLDRGKVVERDASGRPTRMIGAQTDITAQKNAERHLALLNERIQLALDAGQVGLWQFETESGRLVWDQRMRDIYGIGPGPAEVPRSTWHDRLHPDDAAEAERAIAITAETGKPMKTSYRIVKPNGEVRHLHALARLVHHSDAPPLLVGSIWDITEQVQNAAALAAEKECLRITLQSIGDAVISTDVGNRITFANPAAARLLCSTQSALVGANIDDVFPLIDEETKAPLASSTHRAVLSLRTVDREEKAMFVRNDGSGRAVRDLASPIIAPDGQVVGAVLVIQDITNARALQRQLAYAARHDPLTGLLNRGAFEENLQAAIGSRDCALLYLDLDRFKLINDTVGHAAGDAVLKLVANTLTARLPHGTVVGRLGGDEFAAVVPVADVDDAMAVAAGLLVEIRAQRLHWAGKYYEIGASIGIAAIDDAQLDLETATARADAACYTAKSAGRNRVSAYSPGVGEAQRNLARIQVASGWADALAERRLVVFGQEVRDLAAPSRPGRHIEILCRMTAADGSIIPPGQFIPAAERFGLMGSIDRWVIEHTLETHAANLMANGLSVAINLSANTLSDPELWPFVRKIIERTRVEPACLVFEITETAAVDNFVAAERFVHDARKAGCRISLDDFGAGLSSFAYLKRFQVDSIKIDGGFIRNLANSRFDRAVVASISTIAHELGVDVVAERIEDAESVSILRSLGIGYGQGFFFHRPQPLDQLLRARQGVGVRKAS